MSRNVDYLLRAVYSRCERRETSSLEPAEVTAMGEALGLSPESVLHLAQQLRDEKLIDLEWGGKVRLTPEGRQRVEGGERSSGDYVEAGGLLVKGNVSNSAVGAGSRANVAIGTGAAAGNAARSSVQLGPLIDGLTELRRLRHELEDDESQQVLEAIETEVQAVVVETRKEASDEQTLLQHLDRAKSLLEGVSGVGNAAVKLAPVLQRIVEALGIGHIGG